MGDSSSPYTSLVHVIYYTTPVRVRKESQVDEQLFQNSNVRQGKRLSLGPGGTGSQTFYLNVLHVA